MKAQRAAADGRHRAAVRAAATRAQRKKKRHEAAIKANAKRHSPTYKAQRAAKKSQDALSKWARANGWHLVFLDSASGHPRTGIVDAVLLRIAPKHPDVVQFRLIQLKGGGAGLKPREVPRLEAAVRAVEVRSMYALFDGSALTTIMKPRAWSPT